MATLEIVRGGAPLPEDLEERFRRALGREMRADEREFFGLAPEVERNVRDVEPQRRAA
jgi:hypothetical protein